MSTSRLLVVMVTLTLLYASDARAQELPEDLVSLLETAKTVLGRAAVATDESEPTEDFARSFARAIDELGLGLAQASEVTLGTGNGVGVDHALAAIARHRAMNSELYAEIDGMYIRLPPDGGVPIARRGGPQVPALRPAHVTEAYRLVWEFFLVAPAPEDASQLYKRSIADALVAIGNPACITTVRHAYALTCLDGVNPSWAFERQRLLLRILGSLCQEKSLRAMLDCLTMSAGQHARVKAKIEDGRRLATLPKESLTDEENRAVETYGLHYSTFTFYRDHEHFVQGLLAPYYDQAKAECWRELLRQFPLDELGLEQGAMLERLGDSPVNAERGVDP